MLAADSELLLLAKGEVATLQRDRGVLWVSP